MFEIQEELCFVSVFEVVSSHELIPASLNCLVRPIVFCMVTCFTLICERIR